MSSSSTPISSSLFEGTAPSGSDEEWHAYDPKWLATAPGVAIQNGHQVDLVDAAASGASVKAIIDRIGSSTALVRLCKSNTKIAIGSWRRRGTSVSSTPIQRHSGASVFWSWVVRYIVPGGGRRYRSGYPAGNEDDFHSGRAFSPEAGSGARSGTRDLCLAFIE